MIACCSNDMAEVVEMSKLRNSWLACGTILSIIVLALVVYGSGTVFHGPVQGPSDDQTDVAVLHGPVQGPSDDQTDGAVLHGPVQGPSDDQTDVAVLHGPVQGPSDDQTDVAVLH